ncbi:tRNA (adenosine(37)-N6)-threonylcarbamoyltransferase complex ATPase subunit type 1 TsaE [Woeseia oceani]|uniref:tRNA threonylcarbamoyladenosine biosynthesis protein TsaE n=1 Tax=Woeseia oceani TaxID=1548547 RepID=A0A193LGQ2_9GAMM|nr:tRNA (adenosine(37)-N6)-threonylcarbamoyltransferase complex ATPase subunit type 1 TsaE [Woeseia oceani]ANO51641.1 tRNA (N6-adenosine(37)-N6)-threonylcarbamoyltransferase complex ATPase TsaE [Woeseia oceani]
MAQSVTRTVQLADEAASIALGTRLASHLPAELAGWMILLQGDLGAGKSTVARALLRGLGQTGPVPSPTYTLIEPYELPAGRVYHVDLYRIAGADELEFLGWEELDDGLRLVEWPERVPALFKTADICLQLAYTETGRRAVLRAYSERGAAWLATLPL